MARHLSGFPALSHNKAIPNVSDEVIPEIRQNETHPFSYANFRQARRRLRLGRLADPNDIKHKTSIAFFRPGDPVIWK